MLYEVITEGKPEHREQVQVGTQGRAEYAEKSFDRFAVERVEVDGVFHRITSYNVCYTKLLRGRHRGQVMATPPSLSPDISPQRNRSVITSYSIHYTKLYEIVILLDKE